MISLSAYSVFMLSMILLYGASFSYHAFNISEKANMILKKTDHMSIFILIAGSYTPICLIALRNTNACGDLGLRAGRHDLQILLGGMSQMGVQRDLYGDGVAMHLLPARNHESCRTSCGVMAGRRRSSLFHRGGILCGQTEVHHQPGIRLP